MIAPCCRKPCTSSVYRTRASFSLLSRVSFRHLRLSLPPPPPLPPHRRARSSIDPCSTFAASRPWEEVGRQLWRRVDRCAGGTGSLPPRSPRPAVYRPGGETDGVGGSAGGRWSPSVDRFARSGSGGGGCGDDCCCCCGGDGGNRRRSCY